MSSIQRNLDTIRHISYRIGTLIADVQTINNHLFGLDYKPVDDKTDKASSGLVGAQTAEIDRAIVALEGLEGAINELKHELGLDAPTEAIGLSGIRGPEPEAYDARHDQYRKAARGL